MIFAQHSDQPAGSDLEGFGRLNVWLRLLSDSALGLSLEQHRSFPDHSDGA